VLLAGAVSQYTLALGSLPIAYAAHGALPLPGRERVELLLSSAVALYAVGALISLRLSRGDAAIMLVLFAIQLVLPFPVTRLAIALTFMLVALDVLSSERRHLPRLVRAAFGRPYRSVRRSAVSTSGP
jgi:cation:H+ antiporter